MSSLLDEIKNISKEAAREIRGAGYETDADIRTLTRQDLLELLPGKGLRVRKEIHNVICRLPQHSPKHETIFKDLKDFFLSDRLSDRLTDNETVLVYLHKMKAFTEGLIDLLERNRANPPENPNEYVYVPNSERQIAIPEASATYSKSSSFSFLSPSTWTLSRSSSQKTQATSSLKTTSYPTFPSATQRQKNITVMYKMVVSGKTLGKHLDVIERLNGQLPGLSVGLSLKEAQSDKDSQVTLVFCPIVSRAGTDIDSALQDVSSDKPVIVVAMYHMHSPSAQPSPRANSTFQLGVNVFFHETKGLLNCPQNDDAVNEIRTKLHEINTRKSCMNPQ